MKELVSQLEKIRGRHTELVSVYIPAGYNLVEVINQLVQERATAENIKSKTTRKNVTSALDKIINHLRLFRKTPEHGLVVFCGNVSPHEGESDIRIWSIEPPEPLAIRLYRCDQKFILDPLKDMLREKEVYGLIVLDAGSAEIGLLKGKKVIRLKHLDSVVPPKTVKGGMCVSPDTLVVCKDGRVKPIESLKEGEEILALDVDNFSLTFSKVKKIYKRRVDEFLRITTKNPRITIEATKDHLFFVVNENGLEEIPAEKLRPGMIVLRIESYTNKKEVKKTSIDKIEEVKLNSPKTFYDITLSPHSNFFAESLLVHNSQARYDRLRAEEIMKFMKKVAEMAANIFDQEKDLKGILIGGPGPNKEAFYAGDYLRYDLKQKVLGVVDTGYTGEEGLYELVERGLELIKNASIAREKELLSKFFKHLQREDGLAVYGLKEVVKALEYGALDTLIISEGFDWKRVKLKCSACGHEEVKDVKEVKPTTCPKCGSEMEVVEEKRLDELLIKRAEEFGTKVEIVSKDTREGAQFKELGGIGGILRYKLNG
ncbi:MAG: peptide chain release factor aRF-1 [Candidatus Aenigmarchaeota archaeon]|nr:peptide chain release factor aRF-1 [Candidatus Aenigmarchaeota archaeon]